MWELIAKKDSRLDRFLRDIKEPEASWMSRKAWEALLAEGKIRLNGGVVREAGRRVAAGDRVIIELDPTSIGLKAAKEPAKLIWMSESESYGLFYKEAGIASYPLLPWERDTFANRALAYLEREKPNLSSHFTQLAEPPSMEGGLLQRLDRDTSGIISVAFTVEAKRLFRNAFSEGRIEKVYLALVKGCLENLEGDHRLFFRPFERNKMRAEKEAKAESEEAVLSVRILKKNKDAAMVEVKTKKGMRHVVRAGMQALGAPLVGDMLYGGAPEASFHQLHASRLNSFGDANLLLPKGLEAELPQSFLDCCRLLGLH